MTECFLMVLGGWVCIAFKKPIVGFFLGYAMCAWARAFNSFDFTTYAMAVAKDIGGDFDILMDGLKGRWRLMGFLWFIPLSFASWRTFRKIDIRKAREAQAREPLPPKSIR